MVSYLERVTRYRQANTRRARTEGALNQAGLVSLLLRAKIQEIRQEIEALTAMLEEDQDPEKMSVIQELIGVRCGSLAVFMRPTDCGTHRIF